MQPPVHKRRFVLGLVASLALLAAVVAASLWIPGWVAAEPATESEGQPVTANILEQMTLGQAQEDTDPETNQDQACRLCHADTGAVIDFPSGESLPVQVDLATLNGSAHGVHADTPLACTDCHQAADYQYPHQPVQAPDVRAYQLERSTTCERCHVEPHLTSHPGPETENPVVCTDCHGAHDVLTVEQWQAGEGTAVCVDCHAANNVERFGEEQLSQIVANGLFTDRVNREYCLACHSLEDFSLTFENGDVLPLTIDAQELHNSVHGISNPWQPLECTDCHEQYGFPHAPVEATGVREYNLSKYTRCVKCHERMYERTLDSVHGDAIASGNENAAVCTDCHGAHDTPPPAVPRERISHTCQQCHSQIFDEYAESVHGSALLEQSNPDVPTCIECHGVHNIGDPTTTLFRVRSPELCAQCHADEELMEKYGISTHVFDTYVADFHGTTDILFNPEDPNAEPNTAVCYDCHGVHNIKDPNDPDAGIKANLLETCRQCHPTATANFSDAWTSHYEPSLQNNTLVYLVDVFYAIFIPATVGFFGFLVATDIYRRYIRRKK